MRSLLTMFIVMAFMTGGCRQQNHADQDKQFAEQFMGNWMLEQDGERYTLELKDQVELLGVQESELWSRAEFTISEVNQEGRYIIVHGFSEDLTEEDGKKAKTEYYSKLVLQDNGKQLLYIYDYKNSKIESRWHR